MKSKGEGGRGFTLIELLVVIAIIAVLVSILSPTMTRARDLAEATVCRSNLHQVGVTVAAYAAGMRGALPPFYNYSTYNPSYPYDTYLCYWTTGRLGEAYPKSTWGRYNMAHAHEAGYIENGQILYCPGMRNIHFMWENFPKPWAEDQADGSCAGLGGTPNAIRTGYNYNPHLNGGGYIYRRLFEMPPGKALMIDLIMAWDRLGHYNLEGWNIVFADGHAAWVENPTVWQQFIDGTVPGNYQHLEWTAMVEKLENSQ